MARGVEDIQPDRAEPDLAALGELDCRHRGRDLERRPHRLRVGEAVRVERMDGDPGAGVGGDRSVVADVIPMAVGRDDELERPLAGRELIGDPGQARDRGVDRDRLTCPGIGEDVHVRRHGSDRA